jgi:hypothetical protein
MLSKLFGKSKTENTEAEVDNKELIQAIQKMNLTDMRNYINNKKADFIVNEVGLAEILLKLMNEDKNTKKRYISERDDNSKIKRCFDIVLSILENNKTTSDIVELVIEFKNTFEDIIKKYDHENKEIYSSRFSDAIANAINNVTYKVKLQTQLKVVGNT